MNAFATALGVVLIAVVLLDGFETVILPRGLTRRIRLTTTFYRASWAIWNGVARRIRNEYLREALLSYFCPLSLIVLLGLWGCFLILGFGLVQWGAGGVRPGFATDLYMSGTTFFTLGIGDVTPRTQLGRLVTVIEAGLGFGFLAMVIGYLPVLYQAFSRREVPISLLDARAGSPPTAGQLLIRNGAEDGALALNRVLRDWEQWSAEILENHISYPVLCYYRSQHDRQSWLAALTAILDACALVMVGIDGVPPRQARLTFAMARHAVVDLAAILNCPPDGAAPDRLPAAELARLRDALRQAGIVVRAGPDVEGRLAELRALYEPYIRRLGQRLAFTLPPFLAAGSVHDAWETTAWHNTAHT